MPQPLVGLTERRDGSKPREGSEKQRPLDDSASPPIMVAASEEQQVPEVIKGPRGRSVLEEIPASQTENLVREP